MNPERCLCRPADNPFASHRIDGLAFRSPGPEPEQLASRVRALGGRTAIVGPEGSGKSTLLGELESRLPGEPVWVRLPGASRRPWPTARAQIPAAVGQGHVVLVDGAEQLGPLAWRRLLVATRRARCLVVTLHRPGRLPTLIECRTDVDLLRELVSELAPDWSAAVDLGILYRRHGGNIRLCFRELYDLCAGRPAGWVGNHPLASGRGHVGRRLRRG